MGIPNRNSNIFNFFVAGVSYRTAGTDVRGKFAVNDEQYCTILKVAHANGISQVFVLSTCNRTEIYALADRQSDLTNFLCGSSGEKHRLFSEVGYSKNGFDAVEHLFNVTAGLDSQIPGDYEIVSQLKKAVTFARERGYVSGLMDRVINQALRVSKVIKNNTALSDGTVSVAFAAVKHLREHVPALAHKNLLVIGAGSIATTLCKHLVKSAPNCNITIANRTIERARALADQFDHRFADLNSLPDLIASANMIVVATSGSAPVITAGMIAAGSSKLIIDISVPMNVDEEVANIPGVKLINVDQLSKQKTATLAMRDAELEKAAKFVHAHLEEFRTWYYKNLIIRNAMKTEVTGNGTIKPEKYKRVLKDDSIDRTLRGTQRSGCCQLLAITGLSQPLSA